MSVYVLSTMSSAVSYCFYDQVNRNSVPTANNPVTGDVPVIRKKILIHGGAGLPSLRTGFGEMTKDGEGKPMWTADGVVTTVSEADYELLKTNAVFKKHQEKGLVKVLNRDVTGNHKAVAKEAAGMTSDPFGLMTPEKLKMRVKITTGRQQAEDDQFRI